MLANLTLNGLGQSLKVHARRWLWAANPPTVLHVTHYKAGSQWINRILHAVAWDRLVPSEAANAHFLGQTIRPGAIYPTLYVTREEFETVPRPANSRHFVIIRDLRDTLVSAYFSLKVSHGTESQYVQIQRDRLSGMDIEEGLVYLAGGWLHRIATMQWSWLASGDELLKYEELLTRDVEILERVLLKHCRMPVTRRRLREAILANRFEAKTNGRRRGEEDIASHERKGIAGDWQNYFTPKVKSLVKKTFGSLLIATGYERGFDW